MSAVSPYLLSLGDERLLFVDFCGESRTAGGALPDRNSGVLFCQPRLMATDRNSSAIATMSGVHKLLAAARRRGVHTAVFANPLRCLGLHGLAMLSELRAGVGRPSEIVLMGSQEMALRSVLSGPPYNLSVGEFVWNGTEPRLRRWSASRADSATQPARLSTVLAREPFWGPVAVFPNAMGVIPACRPILRVEATTDPDWLADTLVAACSSDGWITLHGDVLRSALWPNMCAFGRWIATLRDAHCGRGISLSDVPRRPYIDSLAELAGSGIQYFEVCIDPSTVLSGRWKQVLEFIEAGRHLDLRLAAEGHLIEPQHEWEAFRRGWTCADRLGLDFLQVLGRTPIRSLSSERGGNFSSQLIMSLRRLPNLLLRYESALLALRYSYRPGDHRRESLADFLHRSLQEVRQHMQHAIAAVASLGPAAADIAGARQWSLDRLEMVLAQSDTLAAPPEPAVVRRRPIASAGRTAVVVTTHDNDAHTTACIQSLRAAPGRPFDLVIVDHSRQPTRHRCDSCQGDTVYHWHPHHRYAAFDAAFGLAVGWRHDYIIWLDSAVFAVRSHWLAALLDELHSTARDCVLGLDWGHSLDYTVHEVAMALRRRAISSSWKRQCNVTEDEADDSLLKRLCFTGTTSFDALADWIQVYPASVLHQVGLPVLDDPLLRRTGWGAELSLRVQAQGGCVLRSHILSDCFYYCGYRQNSGVLGGARYARRVAADAASLENLGQPGLADLLRRQLSR